jgi:predicted nucleotidyltransferase
LIGSYAGGDFNLWSDVDIVLIAEFKGKPVERLKLIDAPPGFQVVSLREEESLKLLGRKSYSRRSGLKRGEAKR